MIGKWGYMRGLKTLLAEYSIDDKDEIANYKEQVEDDGLQDSSTKEFRTMCTLLSEFGVESGNDFDEDYELFKQYIEDEDLFRERLAFYQYVVDNSECSDDLSTFLTAIEEVEGLTKESFVAFERLFKNIVASNELGLSEDFDTLLDYYKYLQEDMSNIGVDFVIEDIDTKAYMLYLSLRDIGKDEVDYAETLVLTERFNQMLEDEKRAQEEAKQIQEEVAVQQ